MWIYIKPEHLRSGSSPKLIKSFKLKIIRAQSLPVSESTQPIVIVELIDGKHKIQTGQANATLMGCDFIYNHVINFNEKCITDLAIVYIQIIEKSTKKQIAFWGSPLTAIRPGFRFLDLMCGSNHQLDSCSLYVHFEFN
eukprot:TRINITY_DN2566_c0_g3_i1.p1 TRINITY_DN2566_c0_g3~~TRINITY_DN2566_c0_g3_i1.p1  ORF type:complete len:139 (-),score=46.48 TRINITY_DN2566_c0_g3_i1:74-490(-)